MALLDDILAWSNGLPMWQRDALRRLFQLGKLDAKEIEELYVLLKAGRGLPNPGGLQPQALAQAHLPSTGTSAAAVVLTGMHDLQNVNVIGPAEHLKFAEVGMTVVYGGNGAGKSGYGRVLKRACRARDTKETVLPDARDAKAATKVPEAKFEVTVGGKAKQLHWKQDAAAPDELATIAVFDGKCARAYLDAEQDVAYLPYGLDIVEGLGRNVVPAVTERLRAEIAGISVDATPFADLAGSTKVGQLIGSLSHSTTPNAVTTLATLSTAEQARLKELDATLAEADPTAKAQALRLAAGRITTLRGRVDASLQCLAQYHLELGQPPDPDHPGRRQQQLLLRSGQTQVQAGKYRRCYAGHHALCEWRGDHHFGRCHPLPSHDLRLRQACDAG